MISVKIGDNLPQSVVLTNQAITVSRQVSLAQNQVIKIEMKQRGDFCTIPTDPRSFMPMLIIPRLINN